MRHLAFRFVRRAPSASSAHFVVDPYLDYRRRLDSNWKHGLKRRNLDVDYDAIRSGFNEWWQAFAAYSKDPSKVNKTILLDNSDGLTNVLKLPNTVVDFQETELKHQENVDFLQSDAKNVAEMDEWLSIGLYNHLFAHLPAIVRQSPPYRIRPVFLDACNLLETDYPQIDEGGNLFTTLVGVSLPAQLALIMKSTFSKRNAFPFNFLAIGASYKQSNSAIEQQTSASLLSVNDQENTSVLAFRSISSSIDSFLRRLRVDFTVERTKPDELEPFASASLAFNTKKGRIVTISFMGTYVSERLNIRLGDTTEEPKFAHLCHAHVNLSRIGELLLNK